MSAQSCGRAGGSRGELWMLVAVAVLAVAGLLFYFRFRTSAFPEHAIRFEVTRGEAAARSEAFLRDALGLEVGGYTSATVWRVDEGAKTYLEKELGVERTTALAAETDLWHFTTRYFRPQQKEELQVAVAPDGRVVGFRHLIDEAAPGARPPREQALSLAEAARGQVARLPGQWQLVEGTSAERPARLDWRFTWQRTDLVPRPGGATGPDDGHLRLEVALHGDRLGAFQQYVKVPEAWERDYQRTRFANALVQQLDTFFGLLPLVIGCIVVLVRRFARRDLRWRPAVALAAVGGALAAAGEINQLPTALVRYDTADSWEAFLAQSVVQALLLGLAQALPILLFAVAGEALFRERFPEKLSLGAGFTRRGAMTRPAAVALGVGALLTGLMATYQVAYYVAGARVGIWTPAEVAYDDLFSAVAPWLAPAVVGYNAAVFEEFAFRLFAIPFLAALVGRVVRGRGAALWVAIVASAVVWGFLHSSYPQDPFFARGIEVSLPGILFGWLMVRYGILAPLAVHYTWDAFLYASALDHAGSLPTSVLAYAIAAIPLSAAAVAAIRARLRGAFAPADPLLNRAQPPAARPEAPAPAAGPTGRQYAGLSVRRRRVALALGAAGLAAVLGFGLAAPDRHPFRFDRAEAGARADAALAAAGIDPAGYVRVVTVETREDTLERAYLRENAGREAVRVVYGDFIPTALWQARYLRPLQRDEYRVRIRPDAPPGAPPFSITYDLAETTPGARLSGEEARRLAEAHLRGLAGWREAAPVVVDEATIDRPNRTDHDFVFERRDVRYGDATPRAIVAVVGDRVSGYLPFVKLPEEWVRARTATGLKDVAAGLIPAVLLVSLLGLGVVAFLRLARAGDLPVRPAVVVAIAFAALGLVDEVNRLPLLYQGYPTATPPEGFLAAQLAARSAGLILAALLAGVAASFLLALWRSRIGPDPVPGAERRGWAVDTALLGLALPLALLGLGQAVAALRPGGVLLNDAAAPPTGAATYLPALAGLAEARSAALLAMLAISSYLLLRRALGRDLWVLAVGLALALVPALSARTLADGLEAAVLGGGGVLVVAAAARWLLRANLPAYLVAAAAQALLSGSLTLLEAADGWLLANGVLLVAATLLGLGGIFLWGRRVGEPLGSPSHPREA